MEIKGNPSGNDYVFTAKNLTPITGKVNKVSFYIKGQSAKSLSINISTVDKHGDYFYKPFNLEKRIDGEDFVVEGAPSNQYTGEIDTKGNWVKVTLNTASLNIAEEGKDLFAVKVGKNAEYNLLIDEITFE